MVVRVIGGIVVAGPISVTQDPASNPWIVAGTITADQGAPALDANSWPVHQVGPLPAGANTIGFVGIDPANNDVDVLTLPPVTQGTLPWVIDGSVTQGGPWVVGGAVAITNFPAIQPVSGTVTADQGTTPWVVGDGGGSITVDGTVTADQGTTPWVVGGTVGIDPAQNDVDVLTLPSIPAGANIIGKVGIDPANTGGLALEATLGTRATEATLATRVADATITARLNTLGQKTMANSAPVVIASDQSALPITAAALPLPAGAATEATLATRLADATFTGRINTFGQKAMAASTPVVLASDQTPIADNSATGTLDATDAIVSLVVSGRQTVSFTLTPTAYVGFILPLASTDGVNFFSTAYFAARSDSPPTVTDGEKTYGWSFTGAEVGVVQGTILVPAGCIAVQIRCGFYTSGSMTAMLNAGSAVGDEDLTSTKYESIGATAPLPPYISFVGGTDGTNVRPLTLNNLRELIVAQGSAGLSPWLVAISGTVNAAITSPLVGGRVDTNVGAWLGSAAPTVGQKAMASSIPVAISSNQSAVPISSTQLPAAIGQTTMANSLAVTIASNQSAVPITDNAGSLTVDTPQLPAVLGQTVMAGSVAVAIASNQSVIPINDNAGSLTVDTPQLPNALVGGRLDVNVGAALPAGNNNIGDVDIATMPGGGTVGAAAPATAVQVGHPGFGTANMVAPNAYDMDTTGGSGAPSEWVLGMNLRRSGAGASAELLGQTTMAGSLPVAIASNQSTLNTNIATWVGGSAAPTVGQKTMANSLPVVISSDQAAIPVTTTSAVGTLNNGAETAVAAVAVAVIAAAATRKKLIVQNTGAANARIGAAGVTPTTGIQLVAGGSLVLDGDNCPTNQIFAIREGAISTTIFATDVTA